MRSRLSILEAVRKNQPTGSPLPDVNLSDRKSSVDLPDQFKATLESIGGQVVRVGAWDEIYTYLSTHFTLQDRWINCVPEVGPVTSVADFTTDPHLLENVKLAVLKGHFGVAENGAVWITDECMGDRALPYICERLALVIHAKDIFADLHEAYEFIGNSRYALGTFIAGPSKTADIEQSLVLGAHGPKSLTLFLKD